MASRIEFFWENLTGKDTLKNKLARLLPSFLDLISQLYTEITTKSIAGWAYLLSNPPTEEDYAEHNIRLDALSLQGQKLMLVAHSQGNLFANQAYDYISGIVGTGSVGVVQIAPASSTLRGEYLLADIDQIINSLRALGLASVPYSNILLPISTNDFSGHMLAETYLDANRPARAKVHSMISDAMQQLQTPHRGGSVGAFTVTLTWDGDGDVDLHTFEPNGAHVFYANKLGGVGYLDVDNTLSYGPEHYFASCDSDVLQAGVYRIGINNFAGASGRTATVQVATPGDGVLATRSLGVGLEVGSAGDASPIPVFNVSITRDAATGKFQYSVN